MKKLLLKYHLSNLPVDIIYMDKRGEITQRTIFVKRIAGQKVIAFCMMRGQQRSFDLESILSVSRGGTSYERKQKYTWQQSHVGV